ncbi:MAG: hypothetical protein ACI4LJ_09055 [Anaerovoracaceae bacterium]
MYAASVITREYDIQTTNPDYNSYTVENIGTGDLKDIPVTVENGFFTVKRVTDIKIDLISEEVPEEAVFENLLEKKLPAEAEKFKTKDGTELNLIDTEWTDYEREAATGTLTKKGYDSEPTFPETTEITATLENGETITTTGKLSHVEISGSSYTKDFSVTGKFVGDSDVDYYDLNGTLIPNNPDSPQFTGYESIILQHFGLNPAAYNITSGVWTSDYMEENGQTVRYAKFSGLRKANDWTAYYEEELTDSSPNRLLYTATCYYGVQKEALYNVHVTVEYGKTEIIVGRVVAASIGFLVIAGLVAFLLLFLSKKKKKEKEGDQPAA